MAGITGAAWWTILKGEPSARGSAIAASLTHILIFLRLIISGIRLVAPGGRSVHRNSRTGKFLATLRTTQSQSSYTVSILCAKASSPAASRAAIRRLRNVRQTRTGWSIQPDAVSHTRSMQPGAARSPTKIGHFGRESWHPDGSTPTSSRLAEGAFGKACCSAPLVTPRVRELSLTLSSSRGDRRPAIVGGRTQTPRAGLHRHYREQP